MQIFVVAGEHEINAWFELHLSAVLLLNRPRKVRIHFYS